MSVFDFMATVVTLVIVSTLFISVQVLRRIERQLDEIAKSRDDSVHDALHPVFSARQLRLGRQWFKHYYKTLLQLAKKTRLQLEEARPSREDYAELPPSLLKEMREVCEALVEAECRWKEYVYMISGNVSVASRGESNRRIVEGWNALLNETRGDVSIHSIAPNQMKLKRVNELFENWRARQCGQAVNIDSGDELFQDVWEDRIEWEHSIDE